MLAFSINGTEILATRRSMSSTAGVGATYVLNLNANDVITVVPTETGNTQIVDTGRPSDILSVIRIT